MWLITCFVKWLDWADVHDSYVAVKDENNAVMIAGGDSQYLQDNQQYLDGRATRKFNQFKSTVAWGCGTVFLLILSYYIYVRTIDNRKLKKVELTIVQEDPLPPNRKQIYPPTKE